MSMRATSRITDVRQLQRVACNGRTLGDSRRRVARGGYLPRPKEWGWCANPTPDIVRRHKWWSWRPSGLLFSLALHGDHGGSAVVGSLLGGVPAVAAQVTSTSWGRDLAATSRRPPTSCRDGGEALRQSPRRSRCATPRVEEFRVRASVPRLRSRHDVRRARVSRAHGHRGLRRCEAWICQELVIGEALEERL